MSWATGDQAAIASGISLLIRFVLRAAGPGRVRDAALPAFGEFALIAVLYARWRWVVVLHLPLTLFVVAATGHHWWLDGIVAIVLLWASLAVDTYARAKLARHRELVPAPGR